MKLQGKKVAVVGSRGVVVNLNDFFEDEPAAIISGGAKGVDSCAAAYANGHNIKLVEFLPDYSRFGRCAPLKRNNLIVEASDIVIAFWDGKSRGTKYTIDYARKAGKKVLIFGF